MNAITLLSGWGGSSLDGSRTSLQDILSRNRIEARARFGPEGNGRDAQLKQHDDGSQGSASSRSGIDSKANTESEVDPELILKPPESKRYEQLEAEVQDMIPESLLLGLSPPSPLSPDVNIYPSPPPTPPIPSPDHVDRHLSTQPETLSSEPKPSQTSQDKEEDHPRLHQQVFAEKTNIDSQTRQQSRRLTERSSHAIARSFPVRCAARLYMLLRRFLALFGIRVPSPIPAIIATSERMPLLAPAIHVHTHEHPSPYDNAPRTTVRPPASRSFWRLPGLGSKRRSSSSSSASLLSSIHEHQAKEDTSSDSSTSPAVLKHEKVRRLSVSSTASINSSTAKQRSLNLGHGKTSSKPSVAQNALSKPKMLVLDLDETLIHSTSRMGISGGYGAVTSSADARNTWHSNASGLKVRIVEVVLDGRSVVYHVYKRPWVDFFLRKVSTWYTVIIFTASMREYADPVIDWLDQGNGLINGRLFREHCTFTNGSYVKDMTVVDPDLARVCLVDNSPISYAKDPANGIPIEGWINDPNDEALLDLLPMLDSLRFTDDVRHILGLRLASTSTVLSAVSGQSVRSGRKPRAAVAASIAVAAGEDLG